MLALTQAGAASFRFEASDFFSFSVMVAGANLSSSKACDSSSTSSPQRWTAPAKVRALGLSSSISQASDDLFLKISKTKLPIAALSLLPAKRLALPHSASAFFAGR